MRLNKSNNKGSAIVYITMIIMSSLLIVSLTMGEIVINNIKKARNQHDATVAYFASESAAERMMYTLRNDFINGAVGPHIANTDGQHFDQNYAGFGCDGNVISSSTCFSEADPSASYITGCAIDCSLENLDTLGGIDFAEQNLGGSTYKVEFSEEFNDNGTPGILSDDITIRTFDCIGEYNDTQRVIRLSY